MGAFSKNVKRWRSQSASATSSTNPSTSRILYIEHASLPPRILPDPTGLFCPGCRNGQRPQGVIDRLRHDERRSLVEMHAIRPAQSVPIHRDREPPFPLRESCVNDRAGRFHRSRFFYSIHIRNIEEEDACAPLLEQPDQLPNAFGIFADGAGFLVDIELLKRPVDIDPIVKLSGTLIEQTRARQGGLLPRRRRMQ